MRFLIFLPFFTYGGAEKQAATLAYRLLGLGHEVVAWAFPTPKGNTPLRAEMEGKGVVCYEFPAYPKLDWHGISQGSIMQRFKRRLRWQWQLSTLALQIPNYRFDIVVPFTFFPSLLVALYRKKLGASRIIWNHRGGYDDAGIEYTPFLVDKIRSSQPVFVANSSAGCCFLRDTFLLESTEVHHISNFFNIDSNSSSAPTNRPWKESEGCQLVQIANFFPEKDFDTLLAAMRLLKDSCIQCHLHLAGTFPRADLKHNFSNLLQEMGLSTLVTHHGQLNQAEIKTLLGTAHIGILSSRSEGCPNSVLEYMCSGMPVVGTNIPGIRDLVGEAGRDYLFSVGNVSQLKSLIIELASSSRLRMELGMANQQRLAKLFHPETVFSDWQAIFFQKSADTVVAQK
jgi:glycosyltransferase involved in cell wall biosynthesis